GQPGPARTAADRRRRPLARRRRAVARRRQVRGRARHLRAGDGHPVRRGRRVRHGAPLGGAPGDDPPHRALPAVPAPRRGPAGGGGLGRAGGRLGGPAPRARGGVVRAGRGGPAAGRRRRRRALTRRTGAHRERTTLAGLPTATTPAGRSRLTTAPAPTTVSSPIVIPGSTITPPPSHTFAPIVIGSAASHFARRSSGSSGCVGVSSCTFGPIWVSSPISIAATSRATSPLCAHTPRPTRMR